MKTDGFPSLHQAHELLEWALERNPGDWGEHAKTAARAASVIGQVAGMDANRCFILGLLHDIGRYIGPSGLLHTLEGYRILMQKGWDKPAIICLTHSFPIKDLEYFNGLNDCTPEDTRIIVDLLEQSVYDDEVKLIQLCDAISLPGGVTIMERRLADVMMRHGADHHTPLKWRAFFDLKRHFDQRCGQSVYSLFRNEIEKDLFG